MNLLSIKIGLSLCALFILGVATGFVAGRRSAWQHIMGRSPAHTATIPKTAGTNSVKSAGSSAAERALERWRKERLTEYEKLLNLSTNQMVALEKELDGLSQEFVDLRMDTKAKVNQAVGRAYMSFARELDSEQRVIFFKHVREEAAKAKRDNE